MSVKAFFAKRKKIRAMKHIVNDVRRQIAYMPEGMDLNYWKPACVTEEHGFGDCEDYVILMRERLILAGFILPDNGRLGLVSTTGGTTDDMVDHAVLILHFDGMTYVADNIRGMQKRLGRNWNIVSSVNLVVWWDATYTVGLTIEQFNEIG